MSFSSWERQKGSPFYTRQWLDQYCNIFNMEIINNCGGRLFGVPGKGLASSGFAQEQIEAGAIGEQNLAKLMILAGMMNYTTTFWSMSIPDTKYDTDVDCIVLSGDDTIYLIDAKLYKTHPGTHYESNGFDKLWLKNDMDGSIIKTYESSRNMLMAADKYSKRFPEYKVVPIMALCPNVSGSACAVYG